MAVVDEAVVSVDTKIHRIRRIQLVRRVLHFDRQRPFNYDDLFVHPHTDARGSRKPLTRGKDVLH
jgi:hypothetical protein